MSLMTKRIGDAAHISNVRSGKYDWPSGDDTEIWRHVTNYELFDADTLSYESLEVHRGTSKKIMLRGFLLPNPDCRTESLLVEIPITSYSIDFGLSLGDVNRGFWLNDEDGVWYKLEQAHADYYSTALPCLNIFSQYLKFYDAIVYGCGNQSGQTLVKKVKKTNMFTCAKDIATIHRFSNEYFDFDTVKKNASFFLSNSTSAFEADCGMMKSLEHYQHLQLTKGSSSSMMRSSGSTLATCNSIPVGGEGMGRRRMAGVSHVSAVDDLFSDKKKKRKSPSKASRSEISSADASGSALNGSSGKKRQVKADDRRASEKRAVEYNISDGESGDEEARKLIHSSSSEGLIRKGSKKKIKIEKREGDSVSSAASSSLSNSKDNRIPRALIERRSALPPSSTGRESSAGLPPSTSTSRADGNLSGAGAKSTGLKPDWLIRQEKAAEERERNKRFDTLQALGFTSRDPKAKLHGHSHLSKPAPLSDHLPKSALDHTTATSEHSHTSTQPPLQFHPPGPSLSTAATIQDEGSPIPLPLVPAYPLSSSTADISQSLLSPLVPTSSATSHNSS